MSVRCPQCGANDPEQFGVLARKDANDHDPVWIPSDWYQCRKCTFAGLIPAEVSNSK